MNTLTDPILFWNDVALDLVANNHPDLFNVGKGPGEPRPNLPDQPGPTRTSRAYAITHLAMSDAWLGASGRAGVTYLNSHGGSLPPAPPVTSDDAGAFAVAAAAAYVLPLLYPNQTRRIADALQRFQDERADADPVAADAGTHYGEEVGRAMMALRRDDGSGLDRTYVPRSGPGKHRVDPLNPGQGFLDPRWGEVRPFVIPGLTGAFNPPPPPSLSDARFLTDFNEVRDYGAQNSSVRTTEQRRVGLAWAYDGALRIGVPPRLYNQVVRAIVRDQNVTDTTQLAQLFAAVNAAMADAGISAWKAKYVHHVARPVVAIREAEEGWGPSGDGNGTGYAGNPWWLPLGAPRTNEPEKTALSPNFPAYPSGHATFGAACLQTVRRFFGVPAEPHYNQPGATHPDTVQFNFVSDELDGRAVDGDGSLRTRFSKKYQSAEEALIENGESRIWLGVHWRFDSDGGIQAGRAIGDEAAGFFQFGSPVEQPVAAARSPRRRNRGV